MHSRYTHRSSALPGGPLGVFHPCLWPLKAPGSTLGEGRQTSRQPADASTPLYISLMYHFLPKLQLFIQEHIHTTSERLHKQQDNDGRSKPVTGQSSSGSCDIGSILKADIIILLDSACLLQAIDKPTHTNDVRPRQNTHRPFNNQFSSSHGLASSNLRVSKIFVTDQRVLPVFFDSSWCLLNWVVLGRGRNVFPVADRFLVTVFMKPVFKGLQRNIQ